MKENKNSKTINSSLIRESLIDYNNLANTLKESTPTMVRDILAEQVKQAYANILNEAEDDEIEDTDYDVEDVEDTTEEPTEETPAETEEPAEDGEGMEPTDEPEVETTEMDVEETPAEETTETDGEDDDMSQEFGQYKVEGSEDAYDLRNAQDDEIVKVYKRLKDSDGVTVVKDGDKVEISDNNAGVEYLINLGSNNDSASDMITDDNINTEDMNESKIFEIALNEYDSHVGYTDNYQKKDPMTNPGNSEPSKHGHNADGGVPKGTEKPWSKQKKNADGFGKGVKNECGTQGDAVEAPSVEEGCEAGAKMGAKGRMMGLKSHKTNSGKANAPEQQHHTSIAGEYKGNPTNEGIQKKVEKIFKENKELKAKLTEFTEKLMEAAVVNVNLGGIIKLITENSTSKAEKKEIINRFTNEAHTVKESQALYESIARELGKKPQTNVNINEEKQFTNANSETINESKFYQDESLMGSLGLMHKICG